MKRFTSPEDCYSIFVGDSCSYFEFLNCGQFTPAEAVEEYCSTGWPWDEPATPEIKEALVKCLEDYLESK